MGTDGRCYLLQVTLPPGVEDRSGHTVTVAWVGSSNVLVVVHGGLRKMRAIADTTIVHFGEWIHWVTWMCQNHSP